MPNKEPWIEDFKDGDLIYGLGKQRSKLKEYFEKKNPGLKIETWIIDQYSLIESDEKFRTVKNNPEFIKSLKEHEKYCSAVGKATNVDPDDYDERKAITSTIRRKCKGGLNWIINNTTGRNIHFLLDGINIEKVAGKNQGDPWGDDPAGLDPNTLPSDKKMRVITGSEMRWLYRNWAGATVERVQFWHSDGSDRPKPVPPPWQDDGKPKWKSAFAAYAKSRTAGA